MKVAVIFHRLGPYHWARLEAAARRCKVTAIELSAETREYAWAKIDGPASFERFTLFSAGDSRTVPGREVRARVEQGLSALRPDVVAVPGWSEKGALAALAWCAADRTPAIVMSESTARDEPRTWWKEMIKRRIVALYSSGLVGGQLHQQYLKSLGMNRQGIFTGYDAVDNEYFARQADEVRSQGAALRARYDLPENYFLASARFIEKKNLLRLLSAYARYLQLSGIKAGLCFPDNDAAESTEDRSINRSVRNGTIPEQGAQNSGPWKLVLLGDGPLHSRICHLIDAASLKDFVILPGFKQYDELPVYYGLANAFVHASTSEQWGLVVNEAMASGLPVLVSEQCGCAPDLVKDNVNGFGFDPFRYEQPARLMFQLANMPSERRAKMGSASREIISEWGPERFADGLVSAAQEAIEAGPRPAKLLHRVLLPMLMR